MWRWDHIQESFDTPQTTRNLVTSTDNVVFFRLVGRWVGQGGKTSLFNTDNVDILEYILSKIAARTTTKSRTFLV